MPAGRPDHYDPSMCEIAIELMREGASRTEVAAELGMGSRDTIPKYCEKYPEFDSAIKKGKLLSQSWWEKKGRKNVDNKEFNSTLWYMNMKNRFKWRDKHDVDHGVAQGSLIEKLIDKL